METNKEFVVMTREDIANIILPFLLCRRLDSNTHSDWSSSMVIH